MNQLFKTAIKPIALLPVQVDRRLQMTDLILGSLEGLAKQYDITMLPFVRTDSAVTKATRARKFLADFDPKCKAVDDYRQVATALLDRLKGQLNERQFSLPAEA
jgi:cellulose biosynthesis protein BcsQ